jgi:hypothetical protein
MKRFLIAAMSMAILVALVLTTSAVMIGSFPWSGRLF